MGVKIKMLILLFLTASSVFLAFPAAVSGQTECRIVILKSWDLPEYNVALESFSEILAAQGYQCKTSTYNLRGGANEIANLRRDIQAFRPQLILTVGSRATGVAAKTFRETPVVFSMVLYPVASDFVKAMDRPGGNVTGAAIDIPLRRQFRLLMDIIPNLRRVGVLYSPEETQPVIEEARRVAQSMGLELIAERITSEGDVPEALSRLERQKIQALWSVADGKVFTPQSTKYIIEQAVRKQIPFMGPHAGFVRAGALIALTPNYRTNGVQAAELAIQVLQGANPSTIPIATPRDIEMTLNLRVANHIRLRIPQPIIDQADQVFE